MIALDLESTKCAHVFSCPLMSTSVCILSLACYNMKYFRLWPIGCLLLARYILVWSCKAALLFISLHTAGRLATEWLCIHHVDQVTFCRYMAIWNFQNSHHPQFHLAGISGVWSADLENPTLEPDMKGIEWTVAVLQSYGHLKFSKVWGVRSLGRSSTFTLRTLMSSYSSLVH